MKLIAHIIWKDLRQDAWALLCWLALFPAQVALGWTFLHTDGNDLVLIDQLRIGGTLLTYLQPIMGYLLVLRWVQADELSGTHMFWATRPISGGRLFLAKVTGLFLVFGFLPLLLWLSWWLQCGLGPREIGWLTLETLGAQLAMIAPALLIGSLTADFGRAIMWSLILAIAMIAWSVTGRSALTAEVLQRLPHGYEGIWFTRMFLGAVLLVIGSIMVAARQFLTRNRMRSFVVVGGWALLIFITGRVWKGDFSAAFDLPGETTPSEQIAGLGDRISLSFHQAKMSRSPFRRYTNHGPEYVHSLVVWFDITGLPDARLLGGEHPFQEFRWDDGPPVRSTGPTFSYQADPERALRQQLSLPAPAGDQETLRWGQARLKKANETRAAQGLPPLEDYWAAQGQASEPARLAIRFEVPESALERFRTQPPAYVTLMKATVARWDVTQTLPLAPDSRGEGPMRSLRILSIDNWKTQLVETVPAYRRLGLFRSRINDRRPHPDRPMIRAINTVTGDIEEVYDQNLVPTDIIVGGVQIKWKEAKVRPSQWIRDELWVPKDPDWVEHTRLVVTVEKEVGHFTREIRVDRLAIRLPPDLPTGNAAPVNPTAAGSGAESSDDLSRLAQANP